MTDQVRDFVTTYKPKPTPEPFFGFFKEEIYIPKTDRRPIYMKVRTLINRGHEVREIAEILNTTENKVRRQIQYLKKQIK